MVSFLKTGVNAAVIGDDLVLLDTHDDAYLCLAGGARSLQRTRSGALFIEQGAVQAALDNAGLITTESGAAAGSAPLRPDRSIIHAVAPRRPHVGDVVRAIAAVGDVRKARRGQGLNPFLQLVATGDLSRDHDRLLAAARLFWSVSPWLPIEGECLIRSATLISFLRRSGLAADWVFGVRLWPFSAHCWVQSGTTCLNDDFERLAAYTPILYR